MYCISVFLLLIKGGERQGHAAGVGDGRPLCFVLHEATEMALRRCKVGPTRKLIAVVYGQKGGKVNISILEKWIPVCPTAGSGAISVSLTELEERKQILDTISLHAMHWTRECLVYSSRSVINLYFQ